MTEYSNYNNTFSVENVIELSKNIGINDHTIELEKIKQPLFRHI